MEIAPEKSYDRDGKVMIIHRYKGIVFPMMPTLSSALHKLNTLPTRADDIFICAYPFCGTHWIWELTSMILNKKAERIKAVKEDMMLEAVPQEIVNLFPSVRLLNTHAQPQMLPEHMLSKNKIILLTRNPKDVVVSGYKHVFGMVKDSYDGNFPSYFELFMEGNVYFGDYFQYMKNWSKTIEGKSNILILTYEEASQDLTKVVVKIAEFLEKPTDSQLAEDIADLCTFKKMKAEKPSEGIGPLPPNLWKPNYSFYRTGKVATWKEWLTVAQSERIDDRINKELTDCRIPIQCTI